MFFYVTHTFRSFLTVHFFYFLLHLCYCVHGTFFIRISSLGSIVYRVYKLEDQPNSKIFKNYSRGKRSTKQVQEKKEAESTFEKKTSCLPSNLSSHFGRHISGNQSSPSDIRVRFLALCYSSPAGHLAASWKFFRMSHTCHFIWVYESTQSPRAYNLWTQCHCTFFPIFKTAKSLLSFVCSSFRAPIEKFVLD